MSKSRDKERLLDVALRIQRDALWGNESCISLKRDDGTLLIINNFFSDITLENVIEISVDSDIPKKLLPIVSLHKSIYARVPRSKSIFHSHGDYIMKESLLEPRVIKPIIDDMAQIVGPDLRYAKGINDIDGMCKVLGKRNGVLIKDAGAIVIGRSPWEAYVAVQVLEKSCTVDIEAAKLGGAKPIPKLMAHIMHMVYMKKYSKDSVEK